MKTVIIPNDYHPFVIEVNGVKYTYPEGSEQSVPDEVASAIEHYYKLQPKEKPADGGVLPWVSKENDGDVLKVEDGVWKPGEAKGGEPFVVTIQKNTSDKSYTEIGEAWNKHERIVVALKGEIYTTNYEIFSVTYTLNGLAILNGFRISGGKLLLSTFYISSPNQATVGESKPLTCLPDATGLVSEKEYRLLLHKGARPQDDSYEWVQSAEAVILMADEESTTLISLVEGFLSTLGTNAGDEGQFSQNFPFAYNALLSAAEESLAVHGRVVAVVGEIEMTLLSNNIESHTALFSFSYIYSSHTYLVDMVVNTNAIILHARCLA